MFHQWKEGEGGSVTKAKGSVPYPKGEGLEGGSVTKAKGSVIYPVRNGKSSYLISALLCLNGQILAGWVFVVDVTRVRRKGG